jgi:hypothetical protein
MHLIGFVGIALYVDGLVNEFGSVAELTILLWISPYEIRAARLESLGTQLSYFGWIGIFLTPFVKTRALDLKVLGVVQLFANLLYIDRTRPIWILAVLALGVAYLAASKREWRTRDVLANGALAIGVFLTLFFSIGYVIGKAGGELTDGEGGIIGLAYSLYLYATSSFAYLDQVLAHAPDDAGYLQRVLYPLYRISEMLSLSSRPPTQVLEFRATPYLTNVGTFLHPFYMDGGWVGIVLGIATYSFAFDLLGLLFMNSRKPFAIIAWANLCFCAAISFFVPKSVTTAFWLMTLLGMVSLLIRKPTLRAAQFV